MRLLIARILGVKVLTLIDKKIAPFQMSIISMMPRGLAAAVLASMPLAAGINIQYFPEIVFSIIILTNLATTFGVSIIEHKKLTEVQLISKQIIFRSDDFSRGFQILLFLFPSK
jgi:hypothetical protein